MALKEAGQADSGSLAGVRVVDLTRNVAGPTCTMILGDLGADVIKIKRLGEGDDTRQWALPAWNGKSAVFLSINRNKRSLAVDLDSKEGLEIVVELANRADVVVETFRPGSLRKRSLDYDDLRVADPGLIYCSISAYGRVGTLHQAAGYDRVVQAGSGSTSLTGHPDRPPSRLGISAIDLGASLWATIGVQSALLKRRETGQGCRIDTVCMRRRPGGFRTTSSFTWGAAWCRREAVRRSLSSLHTRHSRRRMRCCSWRLQTTISSVRFSESWISTPSPQIPASATTPNG
jgi:crotonobetainyl-CoA:carnitine CoA-transferase CaiB-like acyl-CoA transferase